MSDTDYSETLNWLFTQTPVFQRDGASAYKPGLDTARSLCAAFGNPHTRFRTIHVAGTNGKGSTAHTLAAILQSAGLKVGLYTSPHLVDFRERIRVNGAKIPREKVVAFVKKYQDMSLGLTPSFFELTMTMAFDHFAAEQVDIAVIEVGLGGRLDSTNIITPELSIITNISLDHTALLGDTHAAIAAEKAGIMKPGVPVIIGEAEREDVRRVFKDTAARVGAPLHFAEPLRAIAAADGGWDYPDVQIHGELGGAFQPKNAATIITALRVANFPEVTHNAIANGFARVCELTGLMGRLTTLQSTPYRLLCDTGHNPGAWQYLGPYLAKIAADATHKLYVVVGFAADKDVDHILGAMPAAAHYVFTRPSSNRGMQAEQLAALAAAHGLHGTPIAGVADAVEFACSQAKDGDTVFVGGSNFVIADFLSARHDLAQAD
jgi:dihydrofolate synthase/folylpolyglutamate synthase